MGSAAENAKPAARRLTASRMFLCMGLVEEDVGGKDNFGDVEDESIVFYLEIADDA